MLPWIRAVAAAIAVLPIHAQAQESPYPARPVRWIVAAAPGTAPDVVARLVGGKLAEALGQPFVIENRPGAIGTVGLTAVAKAPADGYTLGMLNLPYTLAPQLLSAVTLDPQRDLQPVTLLVRNYPVLAVPASASSKGVDDVVKIARARPGNLKYASPGNATPPHLAGALLAHEAKLDLVHIPYKGAGPAVAALLAGDIDLYFGQAVALDAHVKSGKLRLLATAAPKRLAAYPDLPTFAESGLANVSVSDWQGMVAPAGTPAAVLDRLEATITRVLAQDEVIARLTAIGMDPSPAGRAAFTRLVREDAARWTEIVRAAQIRAD